MTRVWVVSVREPGSPLDHRFRFATESEAIACADRATLAGLDASIWEAKGKPIPSH
jgi:hypothetical protein